MRYSELINLTWHTDTETKWPPLDETFDISIRFSLELIRKNPIDNTFSLV